MNHNMTTERALRDVFATASYIDIGEKARIQPGVSASEPHGAHRCCVHGKLAGSCRTERRDAWRSIVDSAGTARLAPVTAPLRALHRNRCAVVTGRRRVQRSWFQAASGGSFKDAFHRRARRARSEPIADSTVLPRQQDNPLSYPVKLPKREAESGKQFGVAPTKTGKHPTSYFDPQHKWVMDGVTYVDKQRYAVRTVTQSFRALLRTPISPPFFCA